MDKIYENIKEYNYQADGKNSGGEVDGDLRSLCDPCNY
jgi:hypothetical protein